MFSACLTVLIFIFSAEEFINGHIAKYCENILIFLCLSLKYPPCYKDMSFWLSESFTENNLCEVVRGIAGDLVEEVHL